MQTAHGCVVQNNRSKSACTLNARKRLNNQAVWPVIFDITGRICARALKTKIPLTLGPRGHHDWPVMSANRKVTSRLQKSPTIYESAASGLLASNGVHGS